MTSVLSLPVAMAYLNVTDPDNATRLQAVIDSAEAVLTQRVGALQPTTRTDRIQGSSYTLVLPVTPVISLTTVTGFTGGALTISDLHLELRSGVVTYNTGMAFVQPWYDVVYSAGRASCPNDLLLAVKELVRHMWKPQRGPANRITPSEDVQAGASYLLPYRVQELIAPHVQPGFA